MSYQVIARKWRPQTFDEVTGQEPITRTLRGAIEHDRLHHAYLFSGARGVGKTTTARLLAKALNCHRADRPTVTPCPTTDADACASCREIAEGRSIDVMEIDAASNTQVQNTRETIINTIAISTARDRYKVFIIDEVHMLSTASFNALLKTLEEPPPRVVFIMATTESHKVPDTILSRCQQFEFRTIAAARIAERLRLIADAEKIDVTADALREIARAGEGSMRDAQSAFDQVISFSDGPINVDDVEMALGVASAELRARVMRAIAEESPREALAVVDDLEMRGHDLRNFCRDMLAHLRDLLVIKISGGEAGGSTDAGDAERRELARAAAPFSESDLVRFFQSLTETEKQLRESAHPRYQLEIGLVKLIEMRRLAPLGQLLERIAALENSLRTGRVPIAGAGSSPPTAAEGGGGTTTGRAATTMTSRSEGAGPDSTTAAAAASPAGTPLDEVPFPTGDTKSAPNVAEKKPGAAPGQGDWRAPSPPAAPPTTPTALKLVPLQNAAAAPASSDLSRSSATASTAGEDLVGRVVPASATPAILTDTPGSAPSPGGAADEITRIKTALDERRKPFLVVAIEGARSACLSGDEFRVEYAPDKKYLRDTLVKPENTKLLREVCCEVAGRDVGVRILIREGEGDNDEGSAAAAPLSKLDAAQREKQQLREMAERHPAVQQLLRTFRGEIIDVGRVEGESPGS